MEKQGGAKYSIFGVVDIQYLRRKNNGIFPKEMAFVMNRGYEVSIRHWTFSAPFQEWQELPAALQAQNTREHERFHGLSWGFGDTPFKDFEKILRYLPHNITIYVKGSEKATYLKTFLPGIVDISPWGCPKACHLPRPAIKCGLLHPDPAQFCAFENALKLTTAIRGLMENGSLSPIHGDKPLKIPCWVDYRLRPKGTWADDESPQSPEPRPSGWTPPQTMDTSDEAWEEREEDWGCATPLTPAPASDDVEEEEDWTPPAPPVPEGPAPLVAKTEPDCPVTTSAPLAPELPAATACPPPGFSAIPEGSSPVPLGPPSAPVCPPEGSPAPLLPTPSEPDCPPGFSARPEETLLAPPDPPTVPTPVVTYWEPPQDLGRFMFTWFPGQDDPPQCGPSVRTTFWNRGRPAPNILRRPRKQILVQNATAARPTENASDAVRGFKIGRLAIKWSPPPPAV